MKIKKVLRRDEIIKFIARLYDGDLHAKRVLSLANVTLGVFTSASLPEHVIGQGLVQTMGKLSKHGVKQVDRLLSNQGVDIWEFFGYWVPYMVGARSEVVVALDWTSFARDAHETIVISMLTNHGRALSANMTETLTPLGITVGRWRVRTHERTERLDDFERDSFPLAGG